MLKVQVLEDFTFSRYNEIKDTLESKTTKKEGKLFTGDIFECKDDIADYLLGENPIKRAVVKVIEIIPEKEVQKTISNETKKATKSKKTIAKK